MNQTPLKTALFSNAAFSTLSGLVLIGMSAPIVDLMGIGSPILYQAVGVGLLLFAAFVAWTASGRPINTFYALIISVADFLWVAGTALLIAVAFSSLEPAGIVTLIVIAAIVLFFGLRQFSGIGTMYALPDKRDTHKLCVAVDTHEPADKMWPIIADLDTIRWYSPNLTQVILRGDAEPGVDAVRECSDVNGKTWGEHCKLYDHQSRQVVFEFLADEPGFPYPFRTMLGGWEVMPKEGGSTVNIWFEVTPKYGFAHPAILAVMARNLARGFGDVVGRMAAASRGESIPEQVDRDQHSIASRLVPCF